MDNAQEQLSDLLRRRVTELENELEEQRLKYQGKINELKVDLNFAKSRLVKAEERIKKLEEKPKVAKPRGPYKSLSELTSRPQIKARKEEIQTLLGPTYGITELNDKPILPNTGYLSFQRIYRLPLRTIDALSKLPDSKWPTGEQLRYAEGKLIAECGGFTEEQSGDVKMIYATDPSKMFARYLKNLWETSWNRKFPPNLKLVLSGDKGCFLN